MNVTFVTPGGEGWAVERSVGCGVWGCAVRGELRGGKWAAKEIITIAEARERDRENSVLAGQRSSRSIQYKQQIYKETAAKCNFLNNMYFHSDFSSSTTTRDKINFS